MERIAEAPEAAQQGSLGVPAEAVHSRNTARAASLAGRGGGLSHLKMVAKRGWQRPAVVTSLVLLAGAYFFLWRSPVLGLFHDDAVYTVTAKALAEGRGYRIISLPHEIPQTKYPFLFPAALSLVWRLWPGFPGNLAALKTLPLLCAVAWFVLSYQLLLRLGARKTQAWCIVLLTAASPLIISLSTSLMSETMFAALFTGALLAARAVERSNSDRMAWLAGVLAALAYLTRTIGVSLLLAIPLALVFQRRYGAARRFVATGAPIACTWLVWIYLHPAPVERADAYYSSANYASWNILTNYTPLEKLGVLLANARLSLVAPITFLGVPAPMWVALFMLVILVFAFAKKVPRLESAWLAVGAYLSICLCWAWPPMRFIAVILPLVLFIIWETLARLGMNRLTNGLAALTFCFALTGDLRPSIAQLFSSGQSRAGRPAAGEAEMDGMYSWLRKNAPEDSVVLADLDPLVFLYTGRKSTRNFNLDPRKLFYSLGPSPEDALGPLEEIIRGTSADFLIVTPEEAFTLQQGNVERFLAGHPGVLELVDRPGSNPGYQIYRIRHGLL